MKSLFVLSLFVSFNLFAIETAKKGLASNYFENMHSLSANFIQSSTNPITNQLQFFSGQIDLKKKENANKFRFKYDPPNQQLVVGSANFIWMVDFDLEQITRYKQNFMEIPMAKLLTDPQFEWIQSSNLNGDQLNYFRVLTDDQENEIVLLFKNEVIQKLVSQDSLGNLVIFELADVIKNQPINDKLFEVNNPNGFDLIEVE